MNITVKSHLGRDGGGRYVRSWLQQFPIKKGWKIWALYFLFGMRGSLSQEWYLIHDITQNDIIYISTSLKLKKTQNKLHANRSSSKQNQFPWNLDPNIGVLHYSLDKAICSVCIESYLCRPIQWCQNSVFGPAFIKELPAEFQLFSFRQDPA